MFKLITGQIITCYQRFVSSQDHQHLASNHNFAQHKLYAKAKHKLAKARFLYTIESILYTVYYIESIVYNILYYTVLIYLQL